MYGPMTPDPVRELLDRVERQAYASGMTWGAKRGSAWAFWRGVACGVAGTLVVIAWWAT